MKTQPPARSPVNNGPANSADPDDDYDGYRKLWWEHWQLPAGLGALCVGLGIWLAVLHSRNADQAVEIAALKESARTGPMRPPSSVRTLRVKPNRAGPGGAPEISVGLSQPPELIELYIDVSFVKLNTFRVIVERRDRIRAGTIHNLVRDSNGELRLAINTSALYPGTYQLAIEGLVNRGKPVRVGWLTAHVSE